MKDTKIVDKESGIVTFEAKFQGEELHAIGEPAWIERDRHTGIVISEDWYEAGMRHRMEGPAFIEREPNTGEVICEEWWMEGELVNRPQAKKSCSTPSLG